MRNGIIGAGNWILDKVKTIDRWPGEGNLCNVLSEEFASGGGPANVLFDLAAADPSLPLYAAGRIGDDAEGRQLLAAIAKRNIDASGMTVSDKLATSYTDVMSGNGRRTFFHFRGANAEFAPEHLEAITAPAKFFYLGYLLLLDAFDAPDPELGTAAVRALKNMRAKGYRTVVDFVTEAPEKFRATVLPALPEIDVLIVNELEAAHCSGLTLRGADGTMNYSALSDAVDFLFDHGVGETVVLHFPEGAAGRTRDGKFIYVPSCDIAKSEIVGSNGAGDAFAAGVIYGLHCDWDLRDAMLLGGASSNFNLRSATASGGAVSLETMRKYLRTCRFTPMDGVPF